MAYYRRTLNSTPGKSEFVRDIIFNLMTIVYWQVTAAGEQRSAKLGNLVYLDKTGIYHKIYYKKREPYTTSEVFTNGKFWFRRIR